MMRWPSWRVDIRLSSTLSWLLAVVELALRARRARRVSSGTCAEPPAPRRLRGRRSAAACRNRTRRDRGSARSVRRRPSASRRIRWAFIVPTRDGERVDLALQLAADGLRCPSAAASIARSSSLLCIGPAMKRPSCDASGEDRGATSKAPPHDREQRPRVRQVQVADRRGRPVTILRFIAALNPWRPLNWTLHARERTARVTVQAGAVGRENTARNRSPHSFRRCTGGGPTQPSVGRLCTNRPSWQSDRP